MSEVQGRPSSTMSTERRYGIAISVALILGGVYWALTGLTEGTKNTQDTYPVQGTSLSIKTSSTDLEVQSGDVTEITVDRRFERNVFGSDPKDKYKDGTLELRDTGCGFHFFGCDTHYVVTVPKDLKVSVDSSSGDVKASGLGGGAELKSTSGDIEAHQIGGTLTLKSSSGDVEADDLTASSVQSDSSSGSVDLTFSEAPSSVDAKSSSGDVTILLPSGDETYQVDTDTSSGDESARVKTDPSSLRTIRAETSSGDVTVEYQR